MKTSLEPEDIQAIAAAVIDALKPMLFGNGKQIEKDIIYTTETLATYLQVDVSWVYRQVSNKAIPYFKKGKYVRFRKSAIDKWIASSERQPISKFERVRCSRVTS